LTRRLAMLDSNDGQVLQYLHLKAEEMWQHMVWDMLKKPSSVPRSSASVGSRSTCSGSSGRSGTSSKSSSSAASSQSRSSITSFVDSSADSLLSTNASSAHNPALSTKDVGSKATTGLEEIHADSMELHAIEELDMEATTEGLEEMHADSMELHAIEELNMEGTQDSMELYASEELLSVSHEEPMELPATVAMSFWGREDSHLKSSEETMAQDPATGVAGRIHELHTKAISGSALMLTISDPMLPGCPIVACSAGFAEFAGEKQQDILGRAQFAGPKRGAFYASCMSLVAAAKQGMYSSADRGLDALAVEGETMSVVLQSRKSGDTASVLCLMKELELDDQIVLMSLQVEVSTTHAAAVGQLRRDISNAEQLLAPDFFYSAPMRRQVVVDSLDTVPNGDELTKPLPLAVVVGGGVRQILSRASNILISLFWFVLYASKGN